MDDAGHHSMPTCTMGREESRHSTEFCVGQMAAERALSNTCFLSTLMEVESSIPWQEQVTLSESLGLRSGPAFLFALEMERKPSACWARLP